jgi:hypothetical protein
VSRRARPEHGVRGGGIGGQTGQPQGASGSHACPPNSKMRRPAAAHAWAAGAARPRRHGAGRRVGALARVQARRHRRDAQGGPRPMGTYAGKGRRGEEGRREGVAVRMSAAGGGPRAVMTHPCWLSVGARTASCPAPAGRWRNEARAAGACGRARVRGGCDGPARTRDAGLRTDRGAGGGRTWGHTRGRRAAAGRRGRACAARGRGVVTWGRPLPGSGRGRVLKRGRARYKGMGWRCCRRLLPNLAAARGAGAGPALNS